MSALDRSGNAARAEPRSRQAGARPRFTVRRELRGSVAARSAARRDGRGVCGSRVTAPPASAPWSPVPASRGRRSTNTSPTRRTVSWPPTTPSWGSSSEWSYAAYEQSASWPERIRGALDALLSFLAAEPAFARMCIVEGLVGRPASTGALHVGGPGTGEPARRGPRRALRPPDELPGRVPPSPSSTAAPWRFATTSWRRGHRSAAGAATRSAATPRSSPTSAKRKLSAWPRSRLRSRHDRHRVRPRATAAPERAPRSPARGGRALAAGAAARGDDRRGQRQRLPAPPASSTWPRGRGSRARRSTSCSGTRKAASSQPTTGCSSGCSRSCVRPGRRPGDWSDHIRRSLAALLTAISYRPEGARLVMLETLAAGPRGARAPPGSGLGALCSVRGRRDAARRPLGRDLPGSISRIVVRRRVGADLRAGDVRAGRRAPSNYTPSSSTSSCSRIWVTSARLPKWKGPAVDAEVRRDLRPRRRDLRCRPARSTPRSRRGCGRVPSRCGQSACETGSGRTR